MFVNQIVAVGSRCQYRRVATTTCLLKKKKRIKSGNPEMNTAPYELDYSLDAKRRINIEERIMIDRSDEKDLPLAKTENNPYEKQMKKCIFCENNVHIDYKNTRLLSQFISPQTGYMYEREITGICHPKYKELKRVIETSRKAGLMPHGRKKEAFHKDPKLFEFF
ncbi:hypothetical protein SNEBB_003789 [Seison nebaliae]|nr:hypothetical protein SNEBB_003789 [Seison nebaliae]